MKIGEVIALNRDIELNKGRRTIEITVANKGDRPVQVGSHFHFFEVNRLLEFDREKAYGMRLDIPSGNAVRFEPGEEKSVTLVEIAGKRLVHGLNNLTEGMCTEDRKEESLKKAHEKGFIS